MVMEPQAQNEGTPDNPTLIKKGIFIATLRERGTVRHAAEAARIHRDTAYEWRKHDEGFAQAWDEAVEDSTDTLESSLYERALHTEGMPGVVATIATLKARRPGRWNEKVQAARAMGEVLAASPILQAVREVQQLLAQVGAGQLPASAANIIEGTAQNLPDEGKGP